VFNPRVAPTPFRALVDLRLANLAPGSGALAAAVALAALLIAALALVAVPLAGPLALAALLGSARGRAVALTATLLLIALIVTHGQ